ncbi:MAG: 50S ribosomal protein L31 [Candidatus Blackburnbacteria bacterium RIFCSPHIGHO2_02_FULL_39_13]|uniref:Large ribosomal subunit protein bL31 n=1 Tax=Candidatus Blackburnbacteria bacterium RIFCSPLOWO2_01_FULL_40_20 TaxID=1797519 RepID=A0A1G1VFL2_9BACT|nr:MAG: Ribosomal protein L31 (Modular protein) [Microgenomates group bacterium GW2011_GWA2_39_19]OGY07310.1 MAG: 50S ribosomal protein L31 [Candidatus Blackburnbacteria bacterium RIFCSPHIGHO2_01_FULL_40_17]OGY08070.1 MAG: 50S ribosomal protein L31 [Candidatus Blackburnbacteria bacterium RIFCSPHIGHO2_02_FULL_39_13]OGY14159.1 MAG: 50S ribosomal protein L31 [Candidatus Blackburnbacteria bacterium RIFCSPLOWO2_01_FULL_40_20]OGY15455.1 MAG: 50S ribosomal protein L31 [Candidatus Blackburnbacteria bac
MKANIHPTWYPETKVVCACGNTFTTGSTIPQIRVEICSACHPFYTGQMRYVDTAGRVDKFKMKQQQTQSKDIVSKKQKRALKKKQKLEQEALRPTNLAEVRS